METSPPPSDPQGSSHPAPAFTPTEADRRHWRSSLRLVAGLLAVWFTVSFGCGILFRDVLDAYTLPGTRFPLGFWFAQQGAIVVFVFLIAIYVVLASRIDARLEAEREASAHGGGAHRGTNR